MTDADAIEAIKQQWRDLWPAASAAIVGAAFPALAADGVPTAMPNTNVSEPDEAIPWAAFAVERRPSVRVTMGEPAKYSTRGEIFVLLHWPAAAFGDVEEGDTQLNKLGGAVRDVYQSKQFGVVDGDDGVLTYTVSLSDSERGADGRWWILAAIVPFEYTETR